MVQTWCFAAGTRFRTLAGDKPVEAIQPNDYVYAAPEDDPYGAVTPRRVGEIFRGVDVIWHLHVGGQVLRTTGEHRFWVRDLGWTALRDMAIGDHLRTQDGRWLPVEDILDTGIEEPVYNFSVEDYHTYFVGSADWGFAVWAHNKGCNDDHHPGFQYILRAIAAYLKKPGLLKQATYEVGRKVHQALHGAFDSAYSAVRRGKGTKEVLRLLRTRGHNPRQAFRRDG